MLEVFVQVEENYLVDILSMLTKKGSDLIITLHSKIEKRWNSCSQHISEISIIFAISTKKILFQRCCYGKGEKVYVS